MVMARPRHGARSVTARDPEERRTMPPSSLRNALQLLHAHLLFNEEDGIEVGSALSSIHDKLAVSPRRALREALCAGLLEEHTDFLGRACVRRGPRSAEVLRRIYDGEPPTRKSLMAHSRAWDEYLGARRARLDAIREAARPTARNTVATLPAWVP